MVAKAANLAEPLTEAVAPVKIREGGFGEDSLAASSRGSVAWEKLKEPLLWNDGASAVVLQQRLLKPMGNVKTLTRSQHNCYP